MRACDGEGARRLLLCSSVGCGSLDDVGAGGLDEGILVLAGVHCAVGTGPE